MEDMRYLTFALGKGRLAKKTHPKLSNKDFYSNLIY